MAYHVFIERAQDGADPRQVAAAIAERYKLPADAIAKRMTAGRFRVKANVDLDTAKGFARDLERLGAVCTIADADAVAQSPPAAPARPSPLGTPPPRGAGGGRPPAIPAGPVRPRTAQSGATAPTLPQTPAAAGATPAAKQPARDEYQSGLAAAFSPTSSEESSPKLGAIDTGEFKLASIDGADDLPVSYAEDKQVATPDDRAFAPPDADDEDLALAVESPAADPALASTVGAGRDDMFAPPDSDEELVLIDAPQPRNTPPPMPVAPPPPDAVASGALAEAAAPEPAARPKPKTDVRALIRERFVQRPRVRFAAGVLLCVVLAWIPARLYFGAKVDGAQAELEVAMQEPVSLAKQSEDAWNELEDIGRAQKALAESRLVNTKISAVLLWLVVGTGLGYVYFRKIPWDRV